MIGAYHGWSGSLFIERPRCIVQPVDPVVADAVHKDYMRQVRGKGEVNEPWGTYDSASSKSDSDSESEFSDSSELEPELSSERLSRAAGTSSTRSSAPGARVSEYVSRGKKTQKTTLTYLVVIGRLVNAVGTSAPSSGEGTSPHRRLLHGMS